MRNTDHAHPCAFRLVRVLDRGWGEMAFEYHWDSTSVRKGEDGQSNPDLNACTLYEYTTYPPSPTLDADVSHVAIQIVQGAIVQGAKVNQGRHDAGWYYPPDPPFADWKFRDPTDGRTAPVALGCFSAVNGWAWDRHKMAGRLHIPEYAPQNEPVERVNFVQKHNEQKHNDHVYVIAAMQEYRFHCGVCGMDAIVPGSHSGPHTILRCFGPRRLNLTVEKPFPASPTMREYFDAASSQSKKPELPVVWRYSFHKHQANAYLDINAAGYVDDSAHIGFGP